MLVDHAGERSMKVRRLCWVLAVLGLAACSAPTLDGMKHAGAPSPESPSDPSPDGGVESAPDHDATHSELAGTAQLVAFTGGDSIAIRWSTIGEDAKGVDKYVVYRDGKPIATVTPGFHADFPEKDGKGYVDSDITAGSSYEYRVEAVRSGTPADVGPSIKVTAPPFTTPPQIQVDTSQAPDLASHGATAKAFLEIWYPKMAVRLAAPEFTPISSFTIQYDPNYDGLAQADWSVGLLKVNADYPRQNPHDLGMYMHESTHLLDAFFKKNVPGWADEGLADWSREFILHDRDPSRPAAGDSYTKGYSQASFLYGWIESTFGVPWTHKLAVAGNQNAFSIDLFDEVTGKSLDVLWTQMGGQLPAYGALRWTSLSNKCVASSGGSARMATCSGAGTQKWTRADSDGSITLQNLDGNCLDVQQGGTTAGTPVDTYPCNGTGSQKWTFQANGTLVNPQSGLCLDDPNGSTVDGTSLRLWDCNASPAQAFTLPN
jgi:hypothetical protein